MKFSTLKKKQNWEKDEKLSNKSYTFYTVYDSTGIVKMTAMVCNLIKKVVNVRVFVADAKVKTQFFPTYNKAVKHFNSITF